MDYKKHFIVGLVFNIMLASVLGIYITKQSKVEDTLSTLERTTLIDYVKGQEAVKYQLDKAIRGEEVAIEELIMAVSVNYHLIQLERQRGISIPANISLFHISLHGYLYQMMREINEGQDQGLMFEELSVLVDMLQAYEDAQGFTYADSTQEISEKLVKADEEVLTSFIFSERNPIFHSKRGGY
ncbi:hypothetical protein DS745_20605 [Anaerobacillus alkaliphilus]|uniref:Uncharacterized protein n=1 Tax=Anaerobacillus alkaliphilus TaxID=1548597 RepID=A0A4Q0VKW6_9BACI|nr:hypothetical protein [Anaerobacillus alkaliphilus]RXI96147.1 hypothetical protein DS745_20605 [Anaerobacillus alkaliphilus]